MKLTLRQEYRWGAALSYVTIVMNIVIGLMVSPLLVSTLGREQYSLYQLMGSFVTYFGVLDFGLGNAVIRYVAKYRTENDPKRMESFMGMVVMLYVIIGAIVAVIGAFLYFRIEALLPAGSSAEVLSQARMMFLIVVFNMTISMVATAFPSALSGMEKFVFRRALTIVRVILRAAIVIWMLYSGTNALQIMIVDTIFNVIMTAISLFYAVCMVHVRVRFSGFDRGLLRELFTYSFYIFLNMLMNELYWNVDRLIIGKLSLYMAAITNISSLIVQYFRDFAGALGGFFLPMATRMVIKEADNEQMTDLMVRVGRLQLMLISLIIVGFGVCGQQFLTLWIGDELGADVGQTYAITLMLMLALLIPLFQTTGISILEAMNRHAFRAIVLAIISVGNVVLSIYLARLMGPMGAAIGTAVSLVIGNILIVNWYYYKKIGLNIPRFFRDTLRKIAPALLVSVAVGCLSLLIPQSGWLTLLVRIALVGGVHCACMYVAMNDEEKALVGGMLRRGKEA